MRSTKVSFFLLLISLFIAIYTSFIQLYYHETYNTFAWDLGIFLQSLESFINRGKLFYNTIELPFNPSGSYFGIHFSPILFLIAIPYAFYPHPLTLFLLKNVLLSSTSIILYRIGRKNGLSTSQSMFVALSYIFYLPLYGPLTCDFHPYSLFPFFLSLTHLYLLENNILKMFLAMVLGLATNELAGVLFLFYGLSVLTKSRKTANKIIIVSFIWLIISITIISLLNPTQLHYYYDKIVHGSEKRSYWQIFDNLFSYFLMIYSPLFFLPLLSPLRGILTILPWLVIATFSEHITYVSPYYQYASFIVAQLFIATIEAISKINKPKFRKVISTVLVGFNLYIVILLGPIGFGALDYLSSYVRPAHYNTFIRYDLSKLDTPNKQAIKNAIELVPYNASVLVQNHIFPHLVRDNVYVSMIPGVTGWPIIFKDLQLPDIKELSAFSLKGRELFHGEKRIISLTINGRSIDIGENLSINFNPPIRIDELTFEAWIYTKRLDIPQVILSSNSFQVGLATNGYIIAILYSQNGDQKIYFSSETIYPNIWYKVIIKLTQNNIHVSINEKTFIKTEVRNLVVAWLVDYVDYVIIDSTTLTWNFRIGCIPLVLGQKYKLIAAGDGVMVFSKTPTTTSFRSLVNATYLAYVYPSDEPHGAPIMIMPLSRLEWKPINGPPTPYCVHIRLGQELTNVNLTGEDKYAFFKQSLKAYQAEKISINCSMVIKGELNVAAHGYYRIDITHFIPSIVEAHIDDIKVNSSGDQIYLASGKHKIEIIWKQIRYPMFKLTIEHHTQ